MFFVFTSRHDKIRIAIEQIFFRILVADVQMVGIKNSAHLL